MVESPVNLSIKPDVTHFFDEDSNTFTYIVKDPGSAACAIIDSVLDINYAGGRISTKSADRLIEHIETRGLKLEWIIETHVHADHLSAAPYLQKKLGGKIGIGDKIRIVQDTFGKIFNAGTEFQRDGSQFDRLFKDGDQYKIGGLVATTWLTAGHTPNCMTHIMGDAAFIGDTLFMPDYGTARADFPGGDARMLYRSIQRILSLPPETRLFLCHDYKPEGRDVFVHETTVAAQRAHNVHVHEGVSEDQFVEMREKRDKTLSPPRLILPALQTNMRAGRLPPAEDNGKVYLKVPINVL